MDTYALLDASMARPVGALNRPVASHTPGQASVVEQGLLKAGSTSQVSLRGVVMMAQLAPVGARMVTLPVAMSSLRTTLLAESAMMRVVAAAGSSAKPAAAPSAAVEGVI